MNILTIENLSKAFDDKVLFQNISFTINEGEKIGLIGSNGCGKSTLLKILTNNLTPDGGKIHQVNGTSIEYLNQNPKFNPELTVLQQVFNKDSKLMNLIRDYENLLDQINHEASNEQLHEELIRLNSQMDLLNAWEVESQVKTVLTKLGIHSFNKKIKHLSGGQRKRVALASALIHPCDLLILDEPTNHMDHETIQWLEDYLMNKKSALLMVTHDRYFLDKVVNKTIELDSGNLYTYTGNYTEYLEKKSQREAYESAVARKKQNLYRSELKWIRAGVQARSTKQKARIDRFKSLKKDVHNLPNDDNELSISVAHKRLGKKVIHINEISKKYDDLKLINQFSAIWGRNETIGIIGKNGLGKSTLLKIILDKVQPDNGEVDIGPTVSIGYFSQELEGMDDSQKALEYIKSYAEYVKTADGSKISASQMMENFLFSNKMQWSFINQLSGGEKRRLHLLKTLMLAPNVLILDEPTNDLDLDTLNILENYINSFNGLTLVVSHDRYFLDRTCDKIIAFEGNGIIKEFVGNYSDYKAFENQFFDTKEPIANPSKSDVKTRKTKTQSKKLSFNEQRELKQINEAIPVLEKELDQLEEALSFETSDYVKLQELTEKKDTVEMDLLQKLERKEELEEKTS